jgi:hypothetical protein
VVECIAIASIIENPTFEVLCPAGDEAQRMRIDALRVTWTRPANSHTGRRRLNAASEAGRIAASDYGHDNPEVFSCRGGGGHRWKAVVPDLGARRRLFAPEAAIRLKREESVPRSLYGLANASLKGGNSVHCRVAGDRSNAGSAKAVGVRLASTEKKPFR